ncbi:MAG TPA: DUF6582 domain-containing protein [Thermomicrobiaceae bacterium]|nr:DUF6582 domain-containing protein [Thermomicrobiaceae bacterium]
MTRLSQEEQDKLPSSDFAFPKERKEPLVDPSHVRDAIARFDQVEGVTNHERDEAWKRIVAAAKKFDIHLSESNWRELFTRNGHSVPKD